MADGSVLGPYDGHYENKGREIESDEEASLKKRVNHRTRRRKGSEPIDRRSHSAYSGAKRVLPPSPFLPSLAILFLICIRVDALHKLTCCVYGFI